MCKRCLLSLIVLLTACSVERQAQDAGISEEPFDILLLGGTVYSGENVEPLIADLAISGDRIAAVGDLGGHDAQLTLEVSGLVVAPGFIDIHTHAVRDDPNDGIFRWPDAENVIRQGVATVMSGPDGGSPLPIGNTLAVLDANPAAVNFGTFVGHGSIRAYVMGEDDRSPSDDELQEMRDQVALAMQQGAFGLSSGLIYPPGRFASTDEVIELAKVAGQYGGIYISHMRQEGLEVLDSVAETIRIGEEGGLPTQITHHKVVGAPMWGRSLDTLALVDDARARGVDVSIDQYPYTASSSTLSIMFPGWSLDGGREALIARLQDGEQRAQIKEDIVHNIEVDRGGNDPANVVLADCAHDSTLNGLNLSEILRQQGRDASHENAAELLMELVEGSNCRAVFHAMSEEDVRRIMQHPVTMTASDGGIEAPTERKPHPRYYGAFARVLGRYVREENLLPLHTAIHKMTRLPAERMGLTDRGRIEVDAVADIAVFDSQTVIDKATFEDPHQYAEGMHHVFLSGEAVLLNGEMTGARPGRVLRSGEYRQ
ncbi:MAG: N-acyl-D-amino-acid deacylase [Gammaproteobacteria bacterium]|jgi:dihydroorotase/N-acyl-D-amino-acid deacylase|nr:MAG: N-acyl-D-amino-acid deacylase [Gammaproteobacteria bacterium]